MERVPGQPLSSRFLFDWSWRRITWQLLPVIAIVLGAFWLVRDLAGGDGTTPPPATVDPQYQARLAANIEFFATRVQETNDSLSYNRLTSLYLERQRLTGDTSDVTRAELAATKSVELAPYTYASLTSLAMVRIAQHDFEEVLALTERANTAKVDVPETLALRGDALMALGRYAEAGENYRAYLEKAPGFSAFSRNAVLAETNGNVDVAIQFWTAAIDSTREESPIDSAWARVQLANLYLTNADLNDADRELATALKVYPGYALAEAGQGRLAAMRGDYREATTIYRSVVARVPSPEFIAPYADVAARSGNTAEAGKQAALMGAIGQLFEANGIRNGLTLILFKLDHGETGPETLAQAKAAYEARPSLAAADTYAWALYHTGRFDEAAKCSAEALRLGTREPLYLFHAGMIAAAQGNDSVARDYLSQALAINPAFHPIHASEAKAELKQLEATK